MLCRVRKMSMTERMEFCYSCSQSIPTCSEWIPHDILQVPNMFPKGVPTNTSLYLSHPLPKVLPFSPIWMSVKSGGTPSSHRNCYIERTWEAAHLMNSLGDVLFWSNIIILVCVCVCVCVWALMWSCWQIWSQLNRGTVWESDQPVLSLLP
jgi:hypothetical protein